jgi:hypothetical protein
MELSKIQWTANIALITHERNILFHEAEILESFTVYLVASKSILQIIICLRSPSQVKCKICRKCSILNLPALLEFYPALLNLVSCIQPRATILAGCSLLDRVKIAAAGSSGNISCYTCLLSRLQHLGICI